MKHLNKLFYLCFIALLTLALSSCGGGDDEISSTGGSGNNETPNNNENNSNPGVAYSGREAGRPYVDLGLSVKWATYNVGASKPSEMGGHYAWGEITTKSMYNTDTYKWIYVTNKFNVSKYCTNSQYGDYDGKTTLELSDDAASRNCRGSWRMPTKAEMQELKDKCTWTWCKAGNTEYNGVAGYKVVSKINNNYLFLPAAGYRDTSGSYDHGVHDLGTDGYYWTSTLGSDGAYSIYRLYFLEIDAIVDDGTVRWEGYSVRPVF